jgi:hypothetical protein
MLVETTVCESDPGYWLKIVENNKEDPTKVLAQLKIAITQLTPPNSYGSFRIFFSYSPSRQCSSQYITEYSNIWVKLSNCLRRVSQKQAHIFLNELESHPNLEKNAYFYSAWGFYGTVILTLFAAISHFLEKSCKRVTEAKQVIMRGIKREAQPAVQLIKALKSLRYWD